MTKASPFHALIVFGKKYCPYWLVVWPICLYFTVNNFVKQNKSSLLSPLRKRCPPQHIKHSRNTRVSQTPTFDEPCSSMLHPLNFVTVVFLVWVPNSGTILHKSVNQIKESCLLKLLWAASQVATQKQKRRKNKSLELAIFVMVAIPHVLPQFTKEIIMMYRVKRKYANQRKLYIPL